MEYRSVEQIQASFAAVGSRLSEEEMQMLDSLIGRRDT